MRCSQDLYAALVVQEVSSCKSVRVHISDCCVWDLSHVLLRKLKFTTSRRREQKERKEALKKAKVPPNAC